MQCLVTLIPYKYYLSVTMSPTITFYLEIFLFHPLMSTNFTKKSDLFSTLKVINDTGTADMQLKPNLEVRQTITLIDNLVSSKKKVFFFRRTSTFWINKTLFAQNINVCRHLAVPKSPELSICKHHWRVLGTKFLLVSQVFLQSVLEHNKICLSSLLNNTIWCFNWTLQQYVETK